MEAIKKSFGFILLATAWWILAPSVTCLVGLMLLINAVGEGLQDAFDLKRNR